MKPELKKLLILNAPYLLFVYLFDKIGQAVRLAPGADLSGKVLSLADGFSAAFATPLPSLAPMDLLILRNQTKPLTDWTQQRQLSRSKRNWLRSAPLTKPQERQRPDFTLKNRKNRYPAAKRETRCPAPHRKRGFSSITRYIRLKRTIPAWRGRINRRNLPSAARNTGRGS